MKWNEWFEYKHGKLYWITGRNKGKEAGFIDSQHRGMPRGYIRVQMRNGKKPMAHRVIYEMHNGPIPEDLVIDHINGNSIDNRIENLRAVTPVENARNRSRRNRNNTSGWPNVSFRKDLNRWQAYLFFDGKNHNLGYFNCPTAAAIVVKRRKKEIY